MHRSIGQERTVSRGRNSAAETTPPSLGRFEALRQRAEPLISMALHRGSATRVLHSCILPSGTRTLTSSSYIPLERASSAHLQSNLHTSVPIIRKTRNFVTSTNCSECGQADTAVELDMRASKVFVRFESTSL